MLRHKYVKLNYENVKNISSHIIGGSKIIAGNNDSLKD